MWFTRMSLEEWFDAHQFQTRYDVGESAVKFLKLRDLGLDLNAVDLRYGHHTGAPELRGQIASEYPGLAPEHVLVTSGGAEAIFAIVAALAKPGDHVIVEHPNYPSTYEVPRGLGCEVELLRLDFATGLRPDLERLASMVNARTRLIIVTHPNNPSGSMITASEQAQLVELAERHRVHLLFDETYRHLSFADPLPAAAALSPWAISVTSMSKCYGLPGIRIGWLATRSHAVLAGVLAVREQVTITNGALSEAIATAVLARRAEFLGRARRHIQVNFRIACEWVEARPELQWVRPQGGVVGSPRFRDGTVADPETLYRTLASEDGVFVIPGRCFEMDNRFFRLGFGATEQEVSVGLRKIGERLTRG